MHHDNERSKPSQAVERAVSARTNDRGRVWRRDRVHLPSIGTRDADLKDVVPRAISQRTR
jgi:hypothetical protein